MSRQPTAYWEYPDASLTRVVAEEYLAGAELSLLAVTVMRAYLRSWAISGDGADQLADEISSIHTRADVTRWLRMARDFGVDPMKPRP